MLRGLEIVLRLHGEDAMAPMNDGDYEALHAAAIVAIAALMTAVLIVVLRPLLERYALARPNARSSHKIPTPQGGGIAVIAATLAVPSGAFLMLSAGGITLPLTALFAAVIVIAGVGVTADLHPITVAPRLLLQALAVTAVIYALPADLRILPVLPWGIERALLVVGGVWFVNLVNFMDGLDWMTVAEVVPITATLRRSVSRHFAATGDRDQPGAVRRNDRLCLFQSSGGKALPRRRRQSSHRPAARLALVLLAGNGGHAAALLLPLYYLADSSLTLFRRRSKGERIWQAHRTHFYQRATDGGFSVLDVVDAGIRRQYRSLRAGAFTIVILPGRLNDVAALLGGAVLVAWLLVTFARGRK